MRERFGTKSTASSTRHAATAARASACILTSAIALACGASNDGAFAEPSDTAAAERQQVVQNPGATLEAANGRELGATGGVASSELEPNADGALAPRAGDTSIDAAAAQPPAVAAPVSPGSLHRPASSLGYNMDYPGDWTNDPPFIDQMKNARAVQGECSNQDPGCDPAAHLDLDEHGWV
jgi:hypothetical protein